MLFTPPALTDVQLAQQFIPQFLTDMNNTFLAYLTAYKSSWVQWWDPNLTAAQMQARLDDQAGGFAVIVAQAQAFVAYAKSAAPTAFSDALQEHTGALDPVSHQPITQFETFGWYYTIDPSKPSGIAVSEPITNWK